MTKSASDGTTKPVLVSDRDTKRDQVFAEAAPQNDFEFSPKVAQVFDDMVGRSVPFYDEMQRMTGEIVRDFAQPGSNVYDLGCATGTTFQLLDPLVPPSVRFVGVDNSQSMLDEARTKLRLNPERSLDLQCADLHESLHIHDASVVIMTLTLQFVRPLHRERIVREIFNGMREQAALIIFEKRVIADSMLNRMFIKFYYDMKRRNGYSELEISQKREALENVLVPYRAEENHALLKGAGFKQIDEFFRWYNFCGILAVK